MKRVPILFICLLTLTMSSTETRAYAQGVEPFNTAQMDRFGVSDVWRKYNDRLTWGRGQCLAILDDGCDMAAPQWQTKMPWGPKVIATWDSIDGDDDPSFGPKGYHGTTVGYPSSQWFEGKGGVAYMNHVAMVRSVSTVHLRSDESQSIAAALQWVIDHREQYNITAINLSSLDDQHHQEPMPTDIDEKLAKLRRLDVWVSAPCGNNQFTDGISWPACQPGVFAIGSTNPSDDAVRNDRYSNTDLVVPSVATSSGNAYAVGSAMVLREAIEVSGYDWHHDGDNLPEAMMTIFQRTGNAVTDSATGATYRQLNLLTAVDSVFEAATGQPAKQVTPSP